MHNTFLPLMDSFILLKPAKAKAAEGSTIIPIEYSFNILDAIEV